MLCTAFHATGEINEERLRIAAQLIVQRHMPLRCRFVEDGSNSAIMLDEVRPKGFFFSLKTPCVDTGGLRAEAGRVLSNAPPVDIRQGPAWRLTLISSNRLKESVVMLEASHLVMDYESMLIFFANYRPYTAAPAFRRSPHRTKTCHQDNWRKSLSAEMLAQRVRRLEACGSPWGPDFSNEERPYSRALGKIVEGGGRLLREAAGRCRVPASAILLASLANALNATTGLEEVLVGIPYAARPFLGSENLIGDFSNTILAAGRASSSRMAGIMESGREVLNALDLWPVHVSQLLQRINGATFQIRMEVAEQADQLARSFAIPGQVTTLLDINGGSTTMRRNLAVTYNMTGDDAAIEVCLAAGADIGVSVHELARLAESEIAAHCNEALIPSRFTR